jgi:hypothetical protein
MASMGAMLCVSVNAKHYAHDHNHGSDHNQFAPGDISILILNKILNGFFYGWKFKFFLVHYKLLR